MQQQQQQEQKKEPPRMQQLQQQQPLEAVMTEVSKAAGCVDCIRNPNAELQAHAHLLHFIATHFDAGGHAACLKENARP